MGVPFTLTPQYVELQWSFLSLTSNRIASLFRTLYGYLTLLRIKSEIPCKGFEGAMSSLWCPFLISSPTTPEHSAPIRQASSLPHMELSPCPVKGLCTHCLASWVILSTRFYNLCNWFIQIFAWKSPHEEAFSIPQSSTSFSTPSVFIGLFILHRDESLCVTLFVSYLVSMHLPTLHMRIKLVLLIVWTFVCLALRFVLFFCFYFESCINLLIFLLYP